MVTVVNYSKEPHACWAGSHSPKKPTAARLISEERCSFVAHKRVRVQAVIKLDVTGIYKDCGSPGRGVTPNLYCSRRDYND